jgi:dihydrofolate reductase
MGKIMVVNNITLDGVMQSPGGPDEDTRGGFTHGGWGQLFQDSVIAKKMGEMMAGADGSLLLGRRTYQQFFSFWPKQTNNPYTEHLNKVRKYVASTTLKEPLPWQNSILLNGDAADAVAAIREKENRNFTVLGSGDLLRSLMKRNLIDEFVLLTFPITLGTGRRLFPDGISVRLRLKESIASTSGVIISTYQMGNDDGN